MYICTSINTLKDDSLRFIMLSLKILIYVTWHTFNPSESVSLSFSVSSVNGSQPGWEEALISTEIWPSQGKISIYSICEISTHTYKHTIISNGPVEVVMYLNSTLCLQFPYFLIFLCLGTFLGWELYFQCLCLCNR